MSKHDEENSYQPQQKNPPCGGLDRKSYQLLLCLILTKRQAALGLALRCAPVLLIADKRISI
jgi:hypothetical protein